MDPSCGADLPFPVGSKAASDDRKGPEPRQCDGAAARTLHAEWREIPTREESKPSRPETTPGSVVPGVRRPVRLALLEELVAAFLRLVGHVGQPGGLTGEQLLADQAVVDQVE